MKQMTLTVSALAAMRSWCEQTTAVAASVVPAARAARFSSRAVMTGIRFGLSQFKHYGLRLISNSGYPTHGSTLNVSNS